MQLHIPVVRKENEEERKENRNSIFSRVHKDKKEKFVSSFGESHLKGSIGMDS